MAGKLPQLHEGKDGLREAIKLINQLRRQLPSNAYLRVPVGPFSLLSTGQTLAIPANATGFVTDVVDIIPDEITGAQATGASIRIGSNATFSDIVPLTALGTALVAGQVVALTLTAPINAATTDIFIDVQTAATGPSLMTAMVYMGGYYR